MIAHQCAAQQPRSTTAAAIMSRAAFTDTPNSFITMLTASVERVSLCTAPHARVALGEQLLSCEKGQAVLQPQIVALAGAAGAAVPTAIPATSATIVMLGFTLTDVGFPRTVRSCMDIVRTTRSHRQTAGSRCIGCALPAAPHFMPIAIGHGRSGGRPGHGVARPTMSGWTIAGMPRHTSSSAAIVNPQARISSTVGRLQWQPPAKRRHGRSR